MKWRDECPLNGAERYLWEKFQSAPKKSGLRAYYREGWEVLRHIEELLFAVSSSWGNGWPGSGGGSLFREKCRHGGCGLASECLIRNIHVPNTEDEWIDLPDAPHFYCRSHGHEFAFGEPLPTITIADKRFIEVLCNPEKHGAPVRSHICNSCGKEYLYCDWATVIVGQCDECVRAIFQKMREDSE